MLSRGGGSATPHALRHPRAGVAAPARATGHPSPAAQAKEEHEEGGSQPSAPPHPSPPSGPQGALQQRLAPLRGALRDALTADIVGLALPTLGTLAVDPLASLVDTSYLGHYGAVELAGTGVALSVCGSLTKLVNIPLLSVTTNLVAQAAGAARAAAPQRAPREPHGTDSGPVSNVPSSSNGAGPHRAARSRRREHDAGAEAGKHPRARQQGEQPSVAEAASLALATASGCGLAEARPALYNFDIIPIKSFAAVILALGGVALTLWGAPQGSELRPAALDFLQVKAITSPATALLLVSQGVFRGLGDTRQPLAATLLAELLNLGLAPLLIFGLGWGVRGAAAAAGSAELAAALWMVAKLAERHPLSLGLDGAASLARLTDFLRLTGLLSLRTLANLGVFATASSLAARSDPAHAAAYQVCLQLWLATSMLADSLAVAAQTLTATALAGEDPLRAQKVVERTTQMGLALGVALALGLGLSQGWLPRAFSSDEAVVGATTAMLPWVLLSQPLNALAFTGDGVLYGASAFGYAARAMAVCAVPAVGIMLLGLLPQGGPPGGAQHAGATLTCVWAGLVALMAARGAAVYVPYALRRAPFQAFFPPGARTRGE